MTARKLYKPGSDLEIPGLEAILEYGDVSKYRNGRIPGAMRINDHSELDRVRITSLDGLHDDPEAGESRQNNSDRHGESAGQMFYRGRTVGITGRVEAGNLGAMRDSWRRFRSQFGRHERDLVIHSPNEIVALTNQTLNPKLDLNADGWRAPTSTNGGTLAGATGGVSEGPNRVGSVTVTGTAGAGQLREYGDITDGYERWRGEDIWVTARMKPVITSGNITSISVGVAQFTNLVSTTPGSGTFTFLGVLTPAVLNTPASASWNTFSQRIPAASVLRRTTHLAPALILNYGAAGTYEMRFTDVGMIFIDAEQATPAAYFDYSTAGFDGAGKPGLSRSSGPSHAVNRIADPLFENYDPATMGLRDWGNYSASITIVQAPISTTAWMGDHVAASLYYRATKDATTTARAMGVFSQDLTQASLKHRVDARRRYRFTAKTNVLAKPTGDLVVSILWYSIGDGLISSNSSEPMFLGENDMSVEATAPDNAYAAVCAVWNATATQSSGSLEFYVSDTCFVDVTDADPGAFFGESTSQEVKCHRRAPRPFLLRKVRKTSDMKSPEQQTRGRAWRDFTMSLRAADPRVYSIDEHRRSYTIPPASQLKFAAVTGTAFPQTLVGQPLVANETFLGNTSGVDPLNGHVAPTGGTWSVTGPLGFTLYDTGDGWMAQANTAVDDDGWAILGTTNRADVEVDCLIRRDYYGSGFNDVCSSNVLARYVNTSNYLRAGISMIPNLKLTKVVAGVETTLATLPFSASQQGQWLKVRLIINTAGRIVVFLEDMHSTTRLQTFVRDVADADLAPGGALATGKIGIYEQNTGNIITAVGHYDDFRAWAPTDPKIPRTPTGFTYEGQSLPYETAWTSISAAGLDYAARPYRLGGVSIKTWPDLGPAETIPTPSSPILARFYRSAEGYTYTNPSVIANCSPLSHMAGAGNFDTGWYIDEFSTAYFNTATILLKRVNATTWLELRWNSLNHTAALERDPGVTNSPYAFELWCSHSATGTLATTRLATWEYDLGMGTLFTIPFDPLRESRYLFAYMLDNVVTFELWKGYPGSASARANEVSLLQSQTYTVPAGLQGVIGSTVAGQAGFAMKIDNPPDTPVCLINTPYVNYLEFSDASFAPPMIECPLIGDVDSPQRIVLGGDLVNPMMMLMIPDEDGVLHSYRVSMTGTIAVGNEVTINLDNGSVTDAQGLNRYGLLDPGSQLPMFQPGLNYITLAANDWNETVSEHLAVYWRDALA